MLDADSEIENAVMRARALAWSGDDEAAKAAFVEALRLDATHFEALNDLGALALASGHRSAARTSYRQAVRCHPSHPIGRVNSAIYWSRMANSNRRGNSTKRRSTSIPIFRRLIRE
jgi:Flp pilus assembly protein TadD